MTKHGHDWEYFKKEFEDSLIFKKIIFIPHLDKIELYTYLSLPNSILVDEIVKNNMLYGLARDALLCDTPIISNYKDELNIDQNKINTLYASNKIEISKQILRVYEKPSIIKEINKLNNKLIKENLNEEIFINYLFENTLIKN